MSVNLDSESSVDRIKEWIKDSPPATAEIGCSDSSRMCRRVVKLLEAHGINVVDASGAEVDVKLIFSQISARDCEVGFVDRPVNPYGYTSGGFGCSVSSNSVRMVSDRTQFTNPGMVGRMDGSRASMVYNAYSSRSIDTTDLMPKNESK